MRKHQRYIVLFVLVSLIALGRCTEPSGRVTARFELPANALGWIWVRVESPEGLIVGAIGPNRVTRTFSSSIPSIPYGQTWVITAEHRDIPWINADVTHAATSEPFFFGPDSNIDLLIQLVPVTSQPDRGPPPPNRDLITHTRRPWGATTVGGSALDSVSGGPNAVSPRAEVVVYAQEDIRSSTREIARGQADSDGSFELEFPSEASPSRVYVGASPDGRVLSDSSTQAGTQASLIQRGVWTASFRAGQGLNAPNPNRIATTSRTSAELMGAHWSPRIPPITTVSAMYPQFRGGNVPLDSEHRFSWQAVDFTNSPSHSYGIYSPNLGQLVTLEEGLGTTSPVTWLWNGLTWSRLPHNNSVPGVQAGYRITYDNHLRSIVLFGGYSGDQLFNDLWRFDGSSWTTLDPTGPKPQPRLGHGLTYDSVRGRVVVYGGCPRKFTHGGECISGALSDTWEFDGQQWHDRTSEDGPGPKSHHVLVYDPTRRRTYLMGGSDSSRASDVWAWDGHRWERLPTTFPSSQTVLPSATWHSKRREVVVFEGYDLNQPSLEQGAHQNLIAFDGTKWSNLSSSVSLKPSPRFDVALSYDSIREELLLLGGHVSDGDRRLWRFDNSGWHTSGQATQKAPSLIDASHAYDTNRQRWVVFGGASNTTPETPTSDLWEFDGQTWYQVEPRQPWPSARTLSQATFLQQNGTFLITGGLGLHGEVLDDGTWLWDGSAWRNIPTIPGARYGGAAAYDSSTQEVVLFGGSVREDGIETPSLDTWTYTEATGWEKKTFRGPAPRRGHVLSFNPVTRQVVMVGGLSLDSPSSYLSDTYSWTGSQWLLGPSLPTGRAFGALGYDEARNRLVYSGGRSSGAENGLSDVLELNSDSWMITRVTQHALATQRQQSIYFPPLRTILSVGGIRIRRQHDGTLSWTGAQWNPIERRVAPGPHCHHRATGDNNITWVAGGCTKTGCSEQGHTTWAWESREWRKISGPIPAPKLGAFAFARGSEPGKALAVGGSEGQEFNPYGYELSKTGWRILQENNIRAKMLSAAYYPPSSNVLIYGGLAPDTTSLASLYAWDGDRDAQMLVSNSPPGSLSAHASIYDPWRKAIILHGGRTSQTQQAPLPTTWALIHNPNTDTIEWTHIADGPPRKFHSLSYDSDRHLILMFGGADSHNPSFRLWELGSDNTWTERRADPPPPARSSHVAFYDPSMKNLIVHGGSRFIDVGGNQDCFEDTWRIELNKEDRPSILGSFRFSTEGVDYRDVYQINIRGSLGGRSFMMREDNQDARLSLGARLEAWSNLRSSWLLLSSVQGSSENLDAINVSVSGHLARDLLGDAGVLEIRITPLGGVANSREAVDVRAAALEVDIAYEQGAHKQAVCGNGHFESYAGESCDDGNLTDGDGCSSDCIQERGFSCSLEEPSVCRSLGNLP